MTRLDNVIKDIENVNKERHAWIYDDNGNIKDDVICGNVLELLYELKDYEIETFDTEKSIDYVVEHATNRWNTYNGNTNIDHNIDVAELKINGYTYMAIMVHRYGDVRVNYTDRFLVRFDNEDEIFYLESLTQHKDIADGRYTCDINIFSEMYYVWDNENQNEVGEFYELEVEDLLESINERA